MQLMNTLSPVLLLSFAAKALSTHVLASTNTTSTNVTVHVVQVGVNGSDTFSPSSVTAAAGDVVQFQFVGGNHSVVQSAFSSPCESIDAATNVTGFSSGFMPVSNSVPVFSVTVNSTTPIYAHCSQTGHCAKGMVVAINAATNGTQTFKAFQALALASGNTTTNAANTSSSTAASAAAASSSAVQAAASATTTTVSTAKGSRSIVDMALVMLLAVFGAFFVGL